MSLPIILAIVLVVAILAWVVVYFVVRQRREAAVRRMFQSDPIDAEIGREALRRVFGILADEDPPDPAPLNRQPQLTAASAEPLPMALGPAGTALGWAGRSPAVAPASLAKPEPAPEIAATAAAAAAAAAAEPIIVPSARPDGFRLFAPDENEAAAAASAPLLPKSSAITGGPGSSAPPAERSVVVTQVDEEPAGPARPSGWLRSAALRA